MQTKIIEHLAKLMGWDEKKALEWWFTPNPHFGNVSPRLMVEIGRGDKVLKFIDAAESEGER